jgi:hypothetical protein
MVPHPLMPAAIKPNINIAMAGIELARTGLKIKVTIGNMFARRSIAGRSRMHAAQQAVRSLLPPVLLRDGWFTRIYWQAVAKAGLSKNDTEER